MKEKGQKEILKEGIDYVSANLVEGHLASKAVQQLDGKSADQQHSAGYLPVQLYSSAVTNPPDSIKRQGMPFSLGYADN